MKYFLRIYYNNSTHDIDLEIVKQFHYDYIFSINHHCSRTVQADDIKTVEFFTDVLFSDHNYVIGWVNRNIKWTDIVRETGDDWDFSISTDEEWLDAEKAIISEA